VVERRLTTSHSGIVTAMTIRRLPGILHRYLLNQNMLLPNDTITAVDTTRICGGGLRQAQEPTTRRSEEEGTDLSCAQGTVFGA